MKPLFKHLLRTLTLGACLLGCGHSQAQAWPVRPVKLIVSQAPGAAPDILARQIGEKLAKGLGQPVLVENRPGAANAIGAQAVAKAAPDGYTLFFATAAALVTNPFTFKTLPYDPARDFTPVSMVGRGPFFVLVHPSVQAKSLAELAALDKATPGNLTFASDGPRGFAGMIGEWLNKTAGTRIRQIPYNVTTQGLQDTVGGTTPVTIQAVGVASPFIKSGALRALAVSSAKRIPGFEDVPAVAETYPGFDINGWFMLVAPTGTPPDILRRLNTEMDLALTDPAIIQRMKDFGVFAERAGTAESVNAFLRSEREFWGRLTKAIGLEAE